MTAPALAGLAQGQHTDEAAAYEDTVSQKAVGKSDDHMDELLATAAGLWAAAPNGARMASMATRVSADGR